jgi:septum formation protein
MLTDLKIVLGSQSPRRKELFEKAGYSFSIKVSEAKEFIDKSLSVESNTMELARQKANAINFEDDEVLVCADTLVSLQDGTILGKPQDTSEAKNMLKLLVNNFHYVTTGVIIKTCTFEHVFYEQTKVFVKDTEDELIDYYIHHHQVLDKAGSYGVQDWFGLTQVEKIEGCFYNVMGFPMPKFFKELKKIRS